MRWRPIEERFWEKVAVGKPDECWLWTAFRNNHGYGRIIWNGKAYIASRVSWMLANGKEPQGMVCHSCDNPSCVNPAHLWLGTALDNNRDAFAKGRSEAARRRAQPTCKHGHPFDADNTRWAKGGKARQCRECGRLRAAASVAANRDARNAYCREWRRKKRELDAGARSLKAAA